MYLINKKTRYEIIRELIKLVDPSILKEIIINSNFYEHVKSYGKEIDPETDVMEYRKEELLSYLDEMEKEWSSNYIDMTDKQFIKIIK